MRLNPICRRLSLEWFAFGPRPPYISIDMPCVRFTPAVCRLCAKQNGLRNVSFLFRRGSGSPFVRSRVSYGYRAWWVHFGRVRFFMAIPTENERTERRGERSRRRGVGTFLRERIGFVMLSAGSTLGQNAEAVLRPRPKPAPKSRMWKPHCGLSGLSSCDSRRK